jgi:hypothetical protein
MSIDKGDLHILTPFNREHPCPHEVPGHLLRCPAQAALWHLAYHVHRHKLG